MEDKQARGWTEREENIALAPRDLERGGGVSAVTLAIYWDWRLAFRYSVRGRPMSVLSLELRVGEE